MAKKVTLETLDKKFDDRFTRLERLMEHGFAAVAGDIARVDGRMETLATKHQVLTLQTQVNSIETQLRDMKHTKLHARVANLEEKVFGRARS